MIKQNHTQIRIKTNICIIALTLFAITLSACEHGYEEPNDGLQRGTLIDAQEICSLTADEAAKRICDIENPQIENHYNLRFYKLTYRTECAGKDINSNALLVIPSGAEKACLAEYLHATISPLDANKTKNGSVPSLYTGSADHWQETRWFGISLAMNGFCVLLPDYIGYGSTSNMEHPYVYYPELSKANIDAAFAAKEFFRQQQIPYDGRIFLAGWSQGAGASLAAHKYIEESYYNDFKVVASSSYAGPYNFTRLMKDVFLHADSAYHAMMLYTWAAYTVNKFADINRPNDQIFSFPVYDQISSLAVPSNTPNKVFNKNFINNVLNDYDAEFISTTDANSFHTGWIPKGKVFLFHGDKDETVPFFNSEDAYDNFSKAGVEVYLKIMNGYGHSDGLEYFLNGTISEFKALK